MGERPATIDFWYGDARRIGTRPLTDVEMKRLLVERIGFRVIAVVSGLLLPFLFFGFLMGMLITFEPGSGKPLGSILVVLIGGLVLLGLLVVAINYFGRKSTALKDDLTVRFVNRYSVGGRDLEVLPASHRVWTVNGSFQRWFRAPVEQEEMAASPLVPAVAEVSQVRFGQTPSAVAVALPSERLLTDAELAELRGLARKNWLAVLPWLLVSGFWFWMLLLYEGQGGRSAFLLFRAPVFGCFTALALVVFGITLYQAYQFRQDARDRRVFPTLEGDRLYERLAVSGELWTEASRPATWRRKPKPEEQALIDRVKQGMDVATTPRHREPLPPFPISPNQQTDKDNTKER